MTRPPRPGLRMALASRLAGRIAQGHWIRLDYPPSPTRANRYGYGRASHPRLAAILGRETAAVAVELHHLMQWRKEFAMISMEMTDATEPFWNSGYLVGVDGATIYSFLRQRRPKRYVEIGSGNSTLFAARARREGNLDFHITSIDPSPRRAIDPLCDTIIRSPLQEVPIDLFTSLEPGDVVLYDGTHQVYTNSDATVFFLDVLPNLPGGVLVGIHDVHLPDDYRPEDYDRYYAEQYLLGCYLLGECAWLKIVLPCWYVGSQPELREIIRPLFERPGFGRIGQPGLLFWLGIEK